MDVDTFKKQNMPKAKISKVKPFINDIRQLRQEGYAYSQIVEFLKLNKVDTTASYVRNICLTLDGEQDDNTI